MGHKPTNVDYQDRFKKKAPSRADHLREYWWKPGQSGRKSVGKVEEAKRKAEAGEPLTPQEKTLLNLQPRPPWKKGESGNPNGNPTATLTSPTAQLKAYLRRAPEEVVAIIEAWLKESKKGNMIATKEILDRLDGKVAEIHRHEGEIPVKLIFVPAQVVLEDKGQDVIEGEATEIKELKEGEGNVPDWNVNDLLVRRTSVG